MAYEPSGDLILHVNMDELRESFKELAGDITERLTEAAKTLSVEAYNHIAQRAQNELHSSREIYVNALKRVEENSNTFVVILGKEATWIEDGMDPHEMLDDLLKNGKTAKDGSRYKVIPFQHNKGPTSQTPIARHLTDSLKKELATRKINYAKIETNSDGSPKTGLLHKFDMHAKPMHEPKKYAGDGFPHGPPGHPVATHTPQYGTQGPSGRPYLYGVRVYQHPQKDAQGKHVMGSDGHPKVNRSIMTFRVASSKQKGTGMWFHPGMEPKHFFDDAYHWAKTTWDNQIIPAVLHGLGIDT